MNGTALSISFNVSFLEREIVLFHTFLSQALPHSNLKRLNRLEIKRLMHKNARTDYYAVQFLGRKLFSSALQFYTPLADSSVLPAWFFLFPCCLQGSLSELAQYQLLIFARNTNSTFMQAESTEWNIVQSSFILLPE